MISYPKTVRKILNELRHCGHGEDASADGISAAFECGASIRFSVFLYPSSKSLEQVSFDTNGCGIMIAAAESVARAVNGRELTDLHGASDLEAVAIQAMEFLPSDRSHCVSVAAGALRKALANYRAKVVEEFQGEKALICTCFGVSEETIVEIIERTAATDIADVAAACNACSGCGSCRMLIQDLIDSNSHETESEIVL